ncbi:glycosyltransferase [Cellulosimicrobium cellulans]|uniref:bifunctional glycosyltransferase/CDP-glycerol:glycerophosphate glycerophosphotransferase n=1 Tax=Cellulosimicrobium cellulans TaxID=1710 RepID=UPI00130D68F8|nr:glycosyltransferase [Cellulosimicrobium cellulans]
MTRPRFTVALSFYDVAPYLPATLRSLERQTYGLRNLQVVLVDDGSTDAGGRIAERFAARHRSVTLIRQQNGGPAAARNRALDVAEGEWFTSVDGDDVLDRDYFAAVARLLDRDRESRASMVAPRFLVLDDRTGRFRDTHPLGDKHRYGDRLARLADEPQAIALGTPFLRTDTLRDRGLRYDHRVAPTYEDAHLIGRYLAAHDDPVVGIAASARYYYRKRATQGSLVQSSWGDADRFRAVPEHGYLGLLRDAARANGGRAPAWAQHMVLYDLIWYLKEEQATSSRAGWVQGELAARFLELLAEIMTLVDGSTIEAHSCNPHPWTMRQALLTRFADDGVLPRVFRWADRGGRAQVSVMHRAPEVRVRAFSGGVEVHASTVGVRVHRYFGEDFMTETSLEWPAADEVALWVDGVPAVLRRMHQPVCGRPSAGTYRLEPDPAAGGRPRAGRIRSAWRVLEVAALATGRSRARVAAGLGRRLVARRRRRAEQAARAAWVAAITERARSTAARERYAGAWLVMDRPGTADDNGEHLYRYLRAERPDIDAYFVLERTSPHWDRLAAEGFALVPYGSDEAALLTLNAAARISSDAVAGCMYPLPRREFGEPPGIFVFLQHGILKDDASRWLNGKRIDLMITSTEAEHESFVGPRSPYALRRDQVALTGLARYDELLRRRRRAGPRRGGVLVMPTWRRALREDLERCASDAERQAVFARSEFGRRWLALLSSSEVADLAERSGEPVRLLLHPLLQRVLPRVDLPAHVQQVDPGQGEFQTELVRSSMLLTDYSSVAFDAAFAGLPVVYYQFDREAMFGGEHPLRVGYFDYVRDGLGPVVTAQADALAALAGLADAGFTVPEVYRRRADATFAFRDEGSCGRIVAAVERRIAEVAAR